MKYLLAIAGEFTIDTLIALISCIVAIIALFLGGTAYSTYRKYKTTFKEKTVIKDNGTDNSQHALTIINNNAPDVATNPNLMVLSADTFKQCMAQAYEQFERHTNANMQQIIAQANQIIKDRKLELSSYTKIDWINIYFESAKNSSDEFMQNIWAKVLAKELECPNSFCYKTLDILKNMSSEDFKLFQKLCSLQVNGYILQSDLPEKYDLSWDDHLKLKDFSLLNLEHSEKPYTIKRDRAWLCSYQDKYAYVFYNNSADEKTFKLSVFTLSSFALELCKVADPTENKDYVMDFAHHLKKEAEGLGDIKLHKIISVEDNEVTYDPKDLLGEQS